MNIINLTQHFATPSQLQAGVVDLSTSDREKLITLITFTTAPSKGELEDRAMAVAYIAGQNGATSAMIGGAGYFMPHLERMLKRAGISPMHSFTVRETVETPQADGSVKKESIFNHVDWVKA
jgi:hypothetical protein